MGFLNKKKLSKSILYFLAEIVIVVVGIFIAILLNNLNEDRKKAEDSRQSLKRISSDLRTEKYVIKQYKKRLSHSKNYLKGVLYNGQDKHLDSIYFHVAQAFKHYKMNAEYINLKYSGKLGLISNNTLRYNIVNYYEVYYAAYKEISDGHKQFVMGDLRQYFQKEFPSDTNSLIDPVIVKQKLKDPRLVNFIKDQIGSYSYVDKNIQTSRIDSLLKMIKRELK